MTAETQQEDRARSARSRVRLMASIALIGGFSAAAWDAWYHTQVAFDGFFSPPHVFGYAVALLLAWLINDTILNPALRTQFGAGFRLPVLPFPVPGVLVLLGFAGLILDNFWHSAFGLNETPWSFPHAMIGWSLLLIILGLYASRAALGPLRWWSNLLFAWLVLIMCIGVIGGPFVRNNSLEMVQAESQIPIYLAQPETQHLFRIYIENNLTRSHPALMLLVPLGAALVPQQDENDG